MIYTRAKRKIEGLKRAAIMPDNFKPFGNDKAKGVIGAGLRYEKAFREHLARKHTGVLCGTWLGFDDDNGSGICQPDAILLEPLTIFECKLSFKWRSASTQLRHLYKPLVEDIWGGEAKLVQVCKFLKPSAKHHRIVKTLEEALTAKEEYLILNWRPL